MAALITVYLARHQLLFRDQGYGADASRCVPVYARAYAGTKLYCWVVGVRRCEQLS